MFTMAQFSVTKTVTEQEFFKENEARIKKQCKTVDKALKREQAANDVFEELLPKLEATAESLSETQELTIETVIESMIGDGPYGEIGRKIIKYQAKERAIQDTILAIRDNQHLTVEDTMKTIRMLSNTQFRNQWKANRLIRYCQTGQV